MPRGVSDYIWWGYGGTGRRRTLNADVETAELLRAYVEASDHGWKTIPYGENKTENNKKDEIDMSKLHPFALRFFRADYEIDVDRIFNMFQDMGFDTSNIEVEPRVAKYDSQNPGEDLNGVPFYYGIDSENKFIRVSRNYLSTISYRDRNSLSDDPGISRFRDYMSYPLTCETESIFRRVIEKANLNGFGIPENLEYLGEQTYLDLSNKKSITWSEALGKGIHVQNAFKLLYGVYFVLNKDKRPEKEVKISELVRNKYYVFGHISDNGGPVTTFRFTGQIENRQNCVDTYGDFCLNSLRLRENQSDEYVLEADSSQRRRYRESLRRHQQYLAEQRIAEREGYLFIRKKRKKNGYHLAKFNEEVSNQLFSKSMHEILLSARDNKVAKTLLKLNKLGYLKNSTRNITIRKSDKAMTYMPLGKETLMSSNTEWVTKGRQEGKYGKVIRKIINEQVPRLKYSDHDIEKLVNHIKAESSDGSFRIVSGDDILDWYDGDSYHDREDTGTLGSSCMRESGCRGFLELYAENPNQIKMVILVKAGMLIGRALIWEDKWMDRIYGTDAIIKAFKNFAKDKGYHCKAEQSSGNRDRWINPETGKSYAEHAVINLDKTNFDEYPYADTFYYIDVTGRQVSNDTSGLNRYAEMRDTGGSLDGSDMVYDEYNERSIHEDDAVYMEYRGEYTHTDSTGYCDESSQYYLLDDMVQLHDGRHVWEDLAVYANGDNEYALGDDVYSCDHSDMMHIEDVTPSVYLEELEMKVCSDNVDIAYEEADYHFVEDQWMSREELESNGYEDTLSGWVKEEEQTIKN